MLYQLSYTHHHRQGLAADIIVTRAPAGLAIGYLSLLTRASAAALAWSLVGPGSGTKTVLR